MHKDIEMIRKEKHNRNAILYMSDTMLKILYVT